MLPWPKTHIKRPVNAFRRRSVDVVGHEDEPVVACDRAKHIGSSCGEESLQEGRLLNNKTIVMQAVGIRARLKPLHTAAPPRPGPCVGTSALWER